MGYQCVDCVGAGQRQPARRGTVPSGAPIVPRLRRPTVVWVLVALNVLVFLVTVAQAGSLDGNNAAPLFQAWSTAPTEVAGGQWWRVVTGGFLHYGPLHLLFNMWALWIIGRELEGVLGQGRFLAVYAVSLLGGSVAVLVFGSRVAVAGASGAVFGLMGGLTVVLRRLHLSLGPVVGLIVVNVVLSVVIPGISLLCHLGGLVVGAAATAGLVYAPARSRTAWQVGTVGGLTGLLLVAALLAV